MMRMPSRSSVANLATFQTLSVKIDDVASLILHANIAENTAQELSLLMLCVFDFFCRLTSWKGELVM